MAKAHVLQLAHVPVQVKAGSQRVSGVLNPLDLSQRPETCNIVAMAPASLITNVHMSGEYYEGKLENGISHAEPIRLPVGMHYQPTRA
jgi:hypothetical protein